MSNKQWAAIFFYSLDFIACIMRWHDWENIFFELAFLLEKE